MQQAGIKRFFSQSTGVSASAGGNSNGQAAPGKPAKRYRASMQDNSSYDITIVNTPAAKPKASRTSFPQSADTSLKSGMSETARISYNTPGLQTVSESPAAERPSTALRPPDADRAKKLQKRLDCEPESATELKKIEEKFKWLHSANRRDSKGRSATDPAYDGARTIQIPETARAKLSGSQKQYWEVKSQYLDVVRYQLYFFTLCMRVRKIYCEGVQMLFFKVGKFYELYEEDAAIAYEVLGYKVTVSGVGRCRQAGVPESGLQTAIAALVAAGHKVGVMEQIETGEEAKKRDKNAIVRRKLTNVQTPATAFEPDDTDSVHLLSVLPVKATGSDMLGGVAFAVLNAAECALMVGYLKEDGLGSALSTLLAYTTPAEVLVPCCNSTDVITRRISAITPAAHITKLPLDESPSPETALKSLENNASTNDNILKSIQQHIGDGDVPAVAAAVLPLLNHVQRMCLRDKLQDSVLQVRPFSARTRTMRLDCTALTNLEVLQGSTGSREGSLLDVLDTCVSVSGKRLIRTWLSQPLCDVAAIMRRQNAVREILGSTDLMQAITEGLGGLPDVDRAIGRVRTALAPPNPGLPLTLQHRDQQRRLNAIRSALNALRDNLRLLREVAAFIPAPSNIVNNPEHSEEASASSSLLAELCAAAPDQQHDACGLLEELPKALCVASTSTQEAGGKKRANNINISSRKSQGRASSTKKSVDQVVLKLAEEKFPDLSEAEDEEARLVLEAGHVTTIVEVLLEQTEVWQGLSTATATLDVLAALARFAQHDGGATCFPEFLATCQNPSSHSTEQQQQPEFDCKGLWHPALASASTSAPIPTDIHLSTQSGRALLLTGPNMGGKSTLLRATSTAVIFAHIGAPVPARACRLSPVDAIFTRLGASDSILQGKSTFMVESEETASILQASTPNSLVILDELGRGTSTFDGYSIAAAVFGHLVKRGCRMLFATHYHPLTDEFSQHVAGVQLGHMGAEFSAPTAGKSHGRVVFKYQLQSGACPKSYGLHVAALAGIPSQICTVADQVGSALEARLSVCFSNTSAAKRASSHACNAAKEREGKENECGAVQNNPMQSTQGVEQSSLSGGDNEMAVQSIAKVLQAAKDGSLAAVQRDLRRTLPA